jgi:Pectate lyase superfamily protein
MTVPDLSGKADTIAACCVNVRDFGVSGDAIQEAINSLTPAGGCICIPPGTYLVRQRLLVNAPIEIRGAGPSSIIKAATGGFNVFELRSGATGARLTGFQIQGAATSENTVQFAIITIERSGVPTNVVIDHILVSGPDSQTGCNNGIQIDRGANDWTVSQNTFERLIGTGGDPGHGYGVLVAAGLRNIITQNHFAGALGQGRHAVYLSDGASYNVVADNFVGEFNWDAFPIFSYNGEASCDFNRISDNIIKNANGAAVNFDSAAISITGVTSHNCVSGNTITGFLGCGIIVDGYGTDGLCFSNQVTDNSISGVGLRGICVTSAKNTDIKSNVIFNASQACPGTHPGILITSAGSWGNTVCDGTSITGNTSYGPSQRCALEINPTEPVPTNLAIFGNRLLVGISPPSVAVELNSVPCIFVDNVLT